MHKLTKISMCAGLMLMTQPVFAVNNDKAVLDFFNNYQVLNQKYDPKLADYFSDDAWVIVTTYGDESESIEKTKGSKVKKIMADAMKYAKASFSTDKYSNVRVKDLGSQQYLITADRFSIEKCYLDKEFSITVKRKNDQNFIITQQTGSNINPSKCTASLKEDLPAKLQAIASMQNQNLPRQIFRGLDLVKVYADGLVMNYQAKMTYTSKNEIDVLKMQMELEPMFIQNACENPELKKELDNGMIVQQTILSNDNQQVLTVKIDKNSCHG